MTVSDMESAADGSGPPPSWGSDQLDFRSVINTIIDTIRFVTKSDNPDPYTREGMPIPQRQRVLCELGVLRLAVACLEAPFEKLYAHASIDSKNINDNSSPSVLELRSLGLLSMRLARHILRQQSSNKTTTLPLVPALLRLLPCGVGSSDCLTELFTDNDMVDI